MNDLASKKAQYDSQFSELIDRSISSITYYVIDGLQDFFDYKEYHSLDYGVEFEFENGDAYYLIWDSQFVSFDLKFGCGSIQKEFKPEANNIRQIDVSKHQLWQAKIGQKIKSIQSNWSNINGDSWSEKIYYPQDLHITFENGQSVIISTVQKDSETSTNYMSDHITIFFDPDFAKKNGVIK
jgi:hypothetical protein